MTALDTLRNQIIGKLLTISDKSYLSAINKIVQEQSATSLINFTDEQKLMLLMSEDDIEQGRVILESELNRNDLKWLQEL